MASLKSWNEIVEEASVAMKKAELFNKFVTPEVDKDGNWSLQTYVNLCDLCRFYPCASHKDNRYPDSCSEFGMDNKMTPEYICDALRSVKTEQVSERNSKTTLTKDDFGICDSDRGDELFKKVLEKIQELGITDEEAKDYHYEESEEAMFNWIHEDDVGFPSEIWWARWPSEMENCLITDSGVWFWYV